MTENRKVSAVVVNWNGRKFLPTCLDSIFIQDYKNLEVIVVDCASRDESVPFIRNHYPLAKVMELKQDFGPPHAINLACDKAQGEFVLILNNDVHLPPNLVSEMVGEMEKDPNAVLTPVELDWKGKYVHSGIPDFWFGRYLYQLIKLEGNAPFYPSTACCFCSKKILRENPLNEALFMYEDTEWGWRLHLRNIKIKAFTSNYFWHKGAGTNLGYSPKQAFYLGRSWLATVFICFKLPTIVLLHPIILLTIARTLFHHTRNKRFKSSWSYLRGIASFFAQFAVFSQIRKNIQKERESGDKEILIRMIGSIGFEKRAKKSWYHRNLGSKLLPERAEFTSISVRDEIEPVPIQSKIRAGDSI